MNYYRTNTLLDAKGRLTFLVAVQAVIDGLTAALAFYESTRIASASWKMLLVGFGAMFLLMMILFVTLFKNFTFEPFSECERIAGSMRPKYVTNISVNGSAAEILSSLENLYKAAEERSGQLGEILVIVSCCIVDASRNRFMIASKYTECLYAMFGFVLSILTHQMLPVILAFATLITLNIVNNRALAAFEDIIHNLGANHPIKFM